MQKKPQALTFKLLLSEIAALKDKIKELSFKEGPQGERGLTGDEGAQGIQGEQGPQGEQGAQGIPGQEGEKGDRGDRGPQGLPGLDGEAGAQGDRGPKGERGLKGPKGDRGEQGPRGEKGAKGDKGAKGKDGASIENVSVEDDKIFVKIEGRVRKEVGRLPKILFGGGGGGRGPKGEKGDPGDGTTQVNTNIGLGATEVVEEVDTASVDSVKWIITVVDPASDKRSIAEVSALHSVGAPRHTEYARILKDVKISIDVQLNAGKLQLLITNNHTAAIVSRVLRIQTTS